METGPLMRRIRSRPFRIMRACALLLPVALLLGATTGAQAQRAGRPARVVTLSGTVYDTLGVPVAGAVVRARPSTDSTVTDSTGAFTLRRRDAGRTTLEVVHAGFPLLSLEVAGGAAGSEPLSLYLLGGVVRAPQPATAVAAPSSAAPVASNVRTDAGALREARRPRTLTGIVTDTTGRALAGAVVEVITEARRSAVTNVEGRYTLGPLAPGAALLRVRRVGFAPVTFPATISADDAVVADVQLESLGQLLARRMVTADAVARNGKLTAFFARRKSGFGQFQVRTDWEARNPLVFSQLMNTFTGVVAANDPRGRKRIYGRGRCEMAVFLDGMNIIVPDGSSVDDFVDIYEVDAVEVHNRVTGLPPEFSGRSNACGVVAVWTRSRAGK